MSEIKISRVECFVFRAPIDVPVVAAFGVSYDRPVILVRIEDQDGAVGWGEVWCNFPNSGAEHRARWIETLLAPRILNRTFESPEAAFDALTAETHVWTIQSGEPGTIAQCLGGIDIALWDLAARRKGISLRQMLSPAALDSVPAYASGINPDGAAEMVARSRGAGFRNFKLKIGFGKEKDIANISQIVGELLDDELFMADANQAWDLSTATDMVGELAEYPLTWLEEPLPADRPTEEWSALRAASEISLAGGENLRGEAAYRDLVRAGWCSFIQPDACKWGGVTGSWRVVQMIADEGLTYCPHFLAGGIGLVASAHLLAAANGAGLLEVDFNTNPLREGLADPYPELVDGAFALNDAPGLGVEPDLAAVQDMQVLHVEVT
jgi:L-alanine-DL-glutamate epimerase-like enolase superfamily enzyme